MYEKIKLLIIALSLMFLSSCNNLNTNKEEVTLYSCIDGDTADFYYDNEILRFRFIGIDTPETELNEAYSKEAAVYTCTLLESSETIEIEFDQNCDEEDKYQRKLVWVFTDGKLIQSEI